MNREKVERLIHLISNDKARERHFFKYVAKSKNPSVWLKFLKDKEFLNPEKSPLPEKTKNQEGYYILHWHILDFLEAVAKENEETPTENITLLLDKIITENYEHIKKQNLKDRNFITEWVLSKIIAKLPIDNLKSIHIEYINKFLDSYWDNNLIASELARNIFPKILKTNRKDIILPLFQTILGYKKVEQDFLKEIVSVLDEFWLFDLLNDNIKEIVSSYPYDFLVLLVDLIEKIFHEKLSMFSVSLISDIKCNKSILPKKYEVQLIFLAKNLIDGLEKEDDIKKLFTLLSRKKEIEILRRLKYYIAYRHFLKLKTFIWNEIVNDNPLEFPEGKREVYIFFSENAEEFDQSQIETILDWIEKTEYTDIDNEVRRIQCEAYAKKEWLNSLLLSKNKKVLDMYKKYNQINPAELKHPGYSVWIESGFVKNPSPYKIEELKDLPIPDLIKKINNYKERMTGELNFPSKKGLAGTLESLISKNPAKYIEHFDIILKELDFYYLYYIIKGLKEVDSEKKTFSWTNFLNLMQNYIEESFDWSVKKVDSFSYSEEFLKGFFSLISKEISEENSSIDFSNVKIIKDILIVSLEKYCPRETPNRGKVVDLVLNSFLGVLLKCTMTYLLWVAKNKFKDNDIRWENEFKDIFEKKLDFPYRGREFSAILGMFFRKLLYIDKNWVWSNFDRIFPKSSESFWKDTISSFLFCTPNVYKNIYVKMREGEHYKKALETNFYSDETITVISQACIAYLFNIEEYDESLIKYIIDNGQVSHIKEMIWSLSHRDIGSDTIKLEKVKKIWDETYNKFKNTNDNDDRKILVVLASLQEHFDRLDVNFNKLKDSFRFCGLDGYPSRFPKMLQKFVKSEPGLTGDLILESIKGDFFFSYDEDVLKAVIEKMYQLNEKDKANRICNAYLGKGFDCLREFYEKYNSSIEK